MSDLILIVPTAAGVLVTVNGLEIRKPMTAKQLCHMSAAFMQAAAKRMEQGEDTPGSWLTEDGQ